MDQAALERGEHPPRTPHDRAGKWRASSVERRRRAGACNKQVPGLKKARLCRVGPGENYAWSAGLLLCE
jgi:hypothetical protein